MSNKLVAILICLLSLWSFAVLSPQNPTDDQVITRLALSFSMLDGRLDIDDFAASTVDKAEHGGHFYADKTPGQPLLALPAIAVAKLLRQARGLTTDPHDTRAYADYAGWATIGCNGVLAALAVAVLFLIALRLGAGQAGAVLAAFALALATPFFGWSTAFFAHSVTGSFLLFGFALILRLGERPSRRACLGLGLLLGFTAVVDLTAVPALAILGVFALLRATAANRLGRSIPPLLVGGIVGGLPLLVYNQLAFGSPLHLGYADTQFDGMAQGLFGVTWPNPLVLLQLLIGLYRGLLPLSPILILVPLGLRQLGKMPTGRGPAIVATLIVLVYFWINSSYYYWNGGWSTGPRHLVAMLPFAVLGLAFLRPASRLESGGIAVLLGLSFALSLACATASMFAPDTLTNPLAEWIWPQLLDQARWSRGLFVLPAALGFLLLARAIREPLRTGSSGVPPAAAPRTDRSAGEAA